MERILALLEGLPRVLIYVVLGAGSAMENLVPPVPADTFVLLGGFLAARGTVETWIVFVATWGCNVASALAVFWLGHRHGRPFFEEGLGRQVLNENQLGRMQRFYRRWGITAIFFTRFLPGLRAVVPAFAGVSHLPFLHVAVPLGAASALWYGALVWLGAVAGRNLERIGEWISNANLVLLAVAILLALGAGVWWRRTRHP